MKQKLFGLSKKASVNVALLLVFLGKRNLFKISVFFILLFYKRSEAIARRDTSIGFEQTFPSPAVKTLSHA